MKQRTKGQNGHAERSPEETLGKEFIVEQSDHRGAGSNAPIRLPTNDVKLILDATTNHV